MLEEKILMAIIANPGHRKRFYCSSAKCLATNKFFKAFANLETKGYIFKRTYRDTANMEFYDMWYPTIRGQEKFPLDK